MTQLIRLYLLKAFWLCLLLKPIVCSRYDILNTPQNQKPNFGARAYFNINYDDVDNRRNFEYQPYQPHYASPQLHQLQYQRRSDDAYRRQRSEDAQNPASWNHQQSIPVHRDELTQPSMVPLPYQGRTEPKDDETDLEKKIRNIFVVGDDDLKIFNSPFNPLSTINVMHADESLINMNNNNNNNNNNATDSSSSQSSLTTRTTELTSSQSVRYTPISPPPPPPPSSPSPSPFITPSTVNSDEPSFKVQRSPDGKLSLVFNDTLSLQNQTTPRTQQSTTLKRRPEIIFPTAPSSSRGETTFKGCEEYEGKSLCKKVRGYPNLSKLDSILPRGPSELSIFFTEDVEQPLNVSQRFGGDPDEIEPCQSVEEFIYPEGGETADSQWLFIVQNHGSFTQRVRIEKCTGNDRPCDIIDDNLPINYRSFCKQSYVYRALVAVSDNGTIVKEQFKIPSCCKCMLRNVKRF